MTNGWDLEDKQSMDKHTPLISVVVPVYNVEQYLSRCVESLLAQTYAPLEIILVDDGSPDGCPAICDSYAAQDHRVQALHKENGGLSDARNHGVARASGEYVVFVDSDDYVDTDYVARLWSLCAETGASMASAGVSEETEGGTVIHQWGAEQAERLPAAKALEEMCYGEHLPVMAWAKIYPRWALLKHPYPKGKIHEDLWTTYLLIEACGGVAVGEKSTAYHYLRHENSILSTNFHAGHYNAVDASQEMVRFMEQNYPECVHAAVARLAKETLSTVIRATRSPMYPEACGYGRAALRGYWNVIFRKTKLSHALKAKLLLFRVSPGLFQRVYLRSKGKGASS